jgi:MFS family permease
VFLLNAGSFVVSAALVASVRGRFSGERTEQEPYAGIRAGVRFILGQPTLRTMTVAFAVFAVSIGSVLVAELPLAVSFGVGSIGFGLIATMFGTGALIGSLAGRFLNESNERRLVVLGTFITTAGFAAVAVAPAFWFVLAAMLVSGTSDGLVDVAVEVIFQRLSPDAVRSRVRAALEAVFLLGLAASFLFAGQVVDAFGPRAAYALAGIGCGVSAFMLIPLVRGARRDRTGSPQRGSGALE